MGAILHFITETVTGIILGMGYFGIVILMALESACIPVPSEVVMPFAGYQVFKGNFSFWPVVFWGVVGQTIGSVITYWIGSTEGRLLLEKYGKYVLIRKSHIHHADKAFEKYGNKIVLIGRVLPIIRSFISLPAGLAKISFKQFLLYSVIGIIPWTIMLTLLGVNLGENWEGIKTYFHQADILIAIMILATIIFAIRRKKLKRNRKAAHENSGDKAKK